jgi:hypothetical protein
METAEATAVMVNQSGVNIRNLPFPITAPSRSFIIVLDRIPMATASAASGIAICPSALFATLEVISHGRSGDMEERNLRISRVWRSER